MRKENFCGFEMIRNLRASDEHFKLGFLDYNFPINDKVGGGGLLHLPGCSSLSNHPGHLLTFKTATL